MPHALPTAGRDPSMDVATRYQPRVRTQSYLDREQSVMPDNTGDQTFEGAPRRKFQRTVTDSDASNAFRKPSLPASATRNAGIEPRPTLGQRRRSTLRDNVRVPSGPRDFPSPGKSTSFAVPSFTDTPPRDANMPLRTLLPASASTPYFPPRGLASEPAARFSFGASQHTSTDDAESPTTPAEHGPDDFGLVPTMSFDDLQSSIIDPNWTSSLLRDFPAVSGGRALPKEERVGTLRNHAPAHAKEGGDRDGISRSASLLGRRMSAAPGPQPTSGLAPGRPTPPPVSQPDLSVRSKRQSNMPPTSASNTAAAVSKAPRKSVGPGLLTNLEGDRKRGQPGAAAAAESPVKSALPRTSSLKTARRTTINPAAAGTEPVRVSTLTATTQSRQNKVKSLQPPPRDQDQSTPNGRSAAKPNANRAHTPSSSGNRRQSTVSGRASGLGARTISPTDARRLKRLSMMQAPPMPSTMQKGPPTPSDETANPWVQPELPRLMQPSPSFIPRKTSHAPSSSARTSPDSKFGLGGGVTLSTKSSYQSLLSNSNSASRLPTPKPRNVHSSTAQYGDDEEIVPPVPAIPKAYESPRDSDQGFSSSLKSSQSAFGHILDTSLGYFDRDRSMIPPPATGATPRGSIDAPSDTLRKRSGEHPRHHKRTSTVGVNAVSSKTDKSQPDANGRKNNNLQPLRLPPLNVAPFNTTSMNRITGAPRPSQELESRHDYISVLTPEPKRTTKTPSTPMTASRATFFSRRPHDDLMQQAKALRSSSSNYALREVPGFMDDSMTRFFDDSDDPETATTVAGVPIPGLSKPRATITPFASGSLPKISGEFITITGRPSEDEYDLGSYEGLGLQNSRPLGPRPKTGGVLGIKSGPGASEESSIGDATVQTEQRKEKEGGGLRRKLSLGWRRSSSKAAQHADNKPSELLQQNGDTSSTSERERTPAKLGRKHHGGMPPPNPPSKSATWSEGPNLPASSRPSLESTHSRRKSLLPLQVNGISSAPQVTIGDADLADVAAGAIGSKIRILRSDQTPLAATRASSWSNNVGGPLANGARPAVTANSKIRHELTASSISALVKDKDDLAADEEIRRLSQKRRDVDAAARESEQLKTRAIAKTPMTADRVFHDRNCTLNIFERGEVFDYEKDGIYFIGTKSARKIVGSVTPSAGGEGVNDGKAGNYGYDDERGDYNIVVGDHLAYRYEVVDVLGKGSFGQVVRCVDHKEGGVVAVKIIRNKKRFHQQALVEVGILGRLREWDPDGAHATLTITSSFYFRSHLCIVTPCLSINLYELIRAHNFTGFSIPLIRRFARQLLACLTLLQRHRIIHCDLKPENILLVEARKADVRVIDFGSSCKEEEKVYTYIQSRFYRSPEVILGSSYGLGIDMWSLGCILAELWTGYPLFPGENEQEQLACIMEIFGPPDRHLVERCTRKKLFFDSVGKPRVTVSSKGRRRRPSSRTLAQALKSDDDAFTDFIARCLRWDPERRMKPNEALGHPFIRNVPLSQRQGIPDEARRSARAKSGPTPAAGAGGASSPSKRAAAAVTQQQRAAEGNAFAQQAAQANGTPAQERGVRPLPETPQTAVHASAATERNHHIVSQAAASHASPRKPDPGRRQSTTVVAGSKRGSNGATLGQQLQHRMASGANASAAPAASSGGGAAASLAQLAARESMSANQMALAQAQGRWRS